MSNEANARSVSFRRPMLNKASAFSLAALFLCLTLGTASAQITGEIRGSVTDSQGAAIVKANIALRNVETGETRNTQSNEAGYFAFQLLTIGKYSVKAEVTGFRASVAEAEVRSGEIASVRFNMEVGAVTEVVIVEDAVAKLDTENAQIQTAVVGAAVQELPVGRNPNLFAITAPGTAPVAANNSFLGTGSYNTNGGRGRGNNITVDNITATDVSVTGTGGPLNPLNFAEIQEVKFIANNFTAEYGRNASSQLQYITKSGTNDLHGEAYDFLQNDKLNARPFFDRSGKTNIVRRNQFGYVVGGPVLIPGLYNGRNRSFFFTSFEGTKTRGAGAAVIAFVPTQAMLGQVSDPTSKALLDKYQLPASTATSGSGATATGTVQQQAPSTTDAWQWSIKGDHNFSQNDRVTARIGSYESTQASTGNAFVGSNINGFGATSANNPRQFNAAYTRIIGPTMVNELRFGYGWSTPSFPLQRPDLLGPRIQFSNGQVDRFGVWEGFPQGRDQRTFQFTDTLTWIKGSHNLKFGADVFYLRANSIFDALARPLLTFADWNAFAAGTPIAYQQRIGNSVRRNRVKNHFYFVQDDWKVTRNLTLNIGMRMEAAGGPTEVDGIYSTLNLDCREPQGIAGSGQFGCFALGGKAFNNSLNWGPRFGFAYAMNSKTVIRGGYGIAYDFIFLNPITNARFLPPFIYTATLNGVTSFAGANSYSAIVAGTSQLQRDTAGQVGKVSTTVRNFGQLSPVIQQNLRNPQTQQFSLGVQREIFGGIVLKGSYVGTRGTYLTRTNPINLIADPRLVPAQSLAEEQARAADYTAVQLGQNGSINAPSNRIDGRFNLINYVESSAMSNYHSFQAEAIRRYSSGYSWNLSYTHGKSIDDSSDALGVSNNDDVVAQNPRDFRNHRGVSAFDMRDRLVIVHRWELPFGKNLANPFLRGVVHGWGFSGITSFRSGFPVNFSQTGARRGITSTPLLGGGNSVRPNHNGTAFNFVGVPAGSQGAYSGTTNPDSVLAISNYASSLGLSAPLIGNFGTLGRNPAYINGERNFDWTLFKNFHINERMNVQFRTEMYNVFNNTAFNTVERNIANTNFGHYTTVAQDARYMQMALRFVF